MRKVTIRRKDAVSMIEGIMRTLAKHEALDRHYSTGAEALRRIKELVLATPCETEPGSSSCLKYHQLTKCDGEAHSNPHIDNCMQCAPRWGWVGPEVKIT